MPNIGTVRAAAVVDEWALVRAGVELAIRQQGAHVTLSVATASELFSRLDGSDERRVDVVVIGQLRDSSQLSAVRRAAQLDLPVIALSGNATPDALIELCAEGAYGVVGRDGHEGELAAALAAVRNRQRFVAPGLLSAMFDSRVAVPRRPRFDLTNREREVLAELASGRSNDEISERLLIGTQTVKTHLNNIYDKLGVRRRTHAVRLAVTHGLL
jgi:DNA-binding NarL/FixJ family response regulator